MPGWDDPASLIQRLGVVLGRLEADMPIWNETLSLVLRLESTLQHLETANFEPPGSCCDCLQDVPTSGHLPSCAIAQDLKAISDWKNGFNPGKFHWQ